MRRDFLEFRICAVRGCFANYGGFGKNRIVAITFLEDGCLYWYIPELEDY